MEEALSPSLCPVFVCDCLTVPVCFPALLIFGTFFACVLFNVFVVTGAFALFNPLVITMIYFVGLFPYIFVIHGLRRNISEKYHLLEELKYFDLDKAQTRSDFDRAFVHSAIVEWYGSKEAFVEYVRGPLREELLATESTGLPLAYALMTSMIPFSGAIDDFLALWRGGADVDCLLSTLIGFGVGLQICWIVATIRVVFYLVDRWAEPWWSGRADYLQTVLLYIATYLWFMLGGITAQSACRADLWLAAVWSIAAFLVAFSLCGGCCWNARAPPGAVTNFMRAFRVVLTRPSVLVPWGYEWHEEPFDDTGARVLREIRAKSPLDRWNVWQTVIGRPDLVVQPGDRLVKTDGRWAYYEQEVCLADSEQAANLEEAEKPGLERRLVLEFMRPSARPAAPVRPRLEVWDTQSALVVSWDHPSALEPYKQVWGWAIAVVDMDHEIWLVVDGVTYAARSLALEGADVAVAKPDLCTIYVSEGLAYGRPYAACIAVLTDRGWSAFSDLSRAVSISASAKVSDAVLGLDPEEDDWSQRPRFACPSKLIPGASSPVTLRPGPRDLLCSERWLRREICVDGNEGLVVEPADTSMKLLMVEKVIPGSPVDEWNSKQEPFELHGFEMSYALQPGDVIKKVNGFQGAQVMLYEMRRKPKKLIMTVDRHCGGNTSYEDSPEAKIFELHCLDVDASKDVEEFDWHVLYSQAEGTLCARMVERDGDELQRALDIFSEMLSDSAIVMVNEGLVQEADRRILLDCRINSVLLADPALSVAEGSVSVDEVPKHRDSVVPEDMPTTSDEIALIELRKALADAAMDEDQLERAIDNFVNSSKVVRQSMAGQELLDKASALKELWRWWRACTDAREELQSVLDFMLEQEARYQDENGEFSNFGIQDPPYDLGPLAVQLENCQAYRSQMAIMIEEGSMVWERLHQSNLRFAAEKRIRAAMKDEREDDVALDEALSAGEACGVRSEVVHAGREIAANWRANHYKIALHDELFQAVKELRRHVDNRKKPGAGAPEQQRMRIAIAGSGLPPDNPLVLEAWGLLRQWEQDNVALRAEARLSSAVERVQGGFNPDAPEAGDLLGSAIAEVAQQGVDAAFLDAARNSLANWQESRLKRARQDLELAMRYLDEDYLKDSLELARTAGIDEESIEQATRLLTRLRMVDEVNKMMDKTMEDAALPPLEAAIQTAHSHFFVEEEMDMLWSGSLQARLRFWTAEVQGAVQVHEAAGLDVVVGKVQKLLERSQEALDLFKSKTGNNKVPDVAIRTLERDMRGLQLVLPGGRDLSNVALATANIERVLGAVERYAEELPEVIAAAEAQVPKGLKEDLVEEAKECQKDYASTIEELEDAISDIYSSGEDLKAALIRARLAGAPMPLIERGFAKLEKKFPEWFGYTKTELELLVAKQEADDIQELSAEGRFLRLQDAADAARVLQPRLEKSIIEEVEDISMALAAERSFVMAVKEAKDILAGMPMSPEDVSLSTLRLGHAIQACEMSAQDEAKKGIPEAEELQVLLEEEGERRQEVLQNAVTISAERGRSLRDLHVAITAAREASVTPEFLAEPYARLRKKKLDFVTSALRNACATGKYSLAFALYHRGLALKAFEERNGGEWRSGAIQAEIKRLRADISTIHGEFVIETSGGAFGTSTWRKNPCYLIRHAKMEFPAPGLERQASKKADKKAGSKSSVGGVRVSVALAEASVSPATMAVHVVRNNKEVHEAGAGYMLMPGYEVLASSHEDDDIPNCEFDLPPSSQPLFIVPSAAKGEVGPFTLIVNATEAVDVIRIPPANCEPQRFQESFEVKWLQERPHQVCMGGGRFRNRAPMVSWYRNPQFRVKLKGPPEEPAPSEQRSALTLPASDPFRSRTPPARARPEGMGALVPAARPNTAPTTPASPEKLDLKKLRAIFDSTDAQRNGMVNKRELIKAIRRDSRMAEFFGLPTEIRQEDGSRDQMEALFQAMDSDSDREITWDEFLAFQASLHLRKSAWSEDASEVNVSKSEVDFSSLDATTPPLLVVAMTPHGRPKAGPAAVHILRNVEGKGEDGLLAENPSHHNVLAQSGLRHTGREYSSASEVGAVLRVPQDRPDEPFIVVPSLKSTNHQGRFTITFMSTQVPSSLQLRPRYDAQVISSAASVTERGDSFQCAIAKRFQDCAQPWAAVEAWRYAVANLLAAESFARGRLKHVESIAKRTAAAIGRFFATPDTDSFSKAAEEVSQLIRQLSVDAHRLLAAHPLLDQPEAAGLGVPFPMAVVTIPKEAQAATLQLKGGAAMPLLALAISGHGRPSLSTIAQALKLGVRHLQVSPSVAEVAGATDIVEDRQFRAVVCAQPTCLFPCCGKDGSTLLPSLIQWQQSWGSRWTCSYWQRRVQHQRDSGGTWRG
ncbi:unnamed protein product [Symbiodinium natans]|uniref:EF-hand domain-containing protein n=1 Tax=Symbiodinium natans TaxID=878477 RepID=A0A812NTF4_9DINO|nr:unnamed protein product [Symbiodinium natans]